MKLAWQRIKIFFYYLHLAWNRWTKPRVYVVQYTYTDMDGNMKYDAHLVRAIQLELREVTAYLQQFVKGSHLIIMGVSEVPSGMYNNQVIGVAEQIVARADAEAEKLKSPAPAVDDIDDEEDDDDETDPTNMLG